jgi:hypothetical protein
MLLPKAQEVKLSEIERQGLEKLIKRHQIGQQMALRARIVLAAAGGETNEGILNVRILCHTWFFPIVNMLSAHQIVRP